MANLVQFRRGAIAGLPAASAGEILLTTDQYRLYAGLNSGTRLLSVLHKIDATTAPTVNEDAGDGYSVGSRWIDTTADKSYVCVDSTVGAAVWQQTSGAGTGGISDGDKGDITVSGSGATWAIDPDAVTYDKIQNVSATKLLLGRNTAGAGDVEEVSFSQLMAWVDGNTVGDLLYYSSASGWKHKAIGTVGKLFTVKDIGGGTLEPSWEALAAFVAAGGSHAAGGVPDPGATAHANQPYFLGDDATWHKRLGGFIIPSSGSNPSYVDTEETTTSTSYVDLTTTQHITFSLDETTDVLVTVSCNVYNTSAGGVVRVAIDVDGTDVDAIQFSCKDASTAYTMANQIKIPALASGSHTLKMQYRVSSGTGGFKWRCMKLERGS